MPQLTIDGTPCEYEGKKTILQVALENDIEAPHYCYHPSMTIVASCRICLAEVAQPNPKNEGKVELIPKLLPTCQTPAAVGTEAYFTKLFGKMGGRTMFPRMLASIFAVLLTVPFTASAVYAESMPQEEALPPGAVRRLGTLHARHPGLIHGLAFDAESRILGFGNNRLLAFDPKTLDAADLGERVGPAFAISPNGSAVVVETQPETVAMRRLSDGETLWAFSDSDENTNHGAYWARSLAISPDGKLVAVGVRNAAGGGTIYLVNGATGELVRTLRDPEERQTVAAVAFVDNDLLVSGGYTKLGGDEGPRVWDVTSGEIVDHLPDHRGSVERLFVSPDGRFVVGGAVSRVYVWGRDKEGWRRLYDHQAGVRGGVAFSRDSKRLFIGGDHQVEVLDPATGRALSRVGPIYDNTAAVALSPDGTKLAAGDGFAVRLFDLATGDDLHPPQGHVTVITALAFSPDGTRLVSGARSPRVLVWDLEAGRVARELTLGENHNASALTYTPDGEAVLAADNNEPVLLNPRQKVLNPRGQVPAPQRLLDRPERGNCRDLRVSGDGRRVAFGQGGQVVVVDLATRHVLHRLGQLDDAPIIDLALSHLADRVAVVRNLSEHTELWDVEAEKLIAPLEPVQGEAGPPDAGNAPRPTAVALTVGGEEIVVGGSDGLDRFHARTGKQIAHLEAQTIEALAASPEGSLLVSVSQGDRDTGRTSELTLRDARTLQPVAPAISGLSPLHALAFSPDGRTFATGHEDSTILIWNVQALRERR